MDKLGQILEQAKKQKEQGQESAEKVASKVKGSEVYKKQISKFISTNRIPRIMLYAIIAVKFGTIFDKLKTLVAVNNIYTQIIHEQRENFRLAFKVGESIGNTASDEELIQDLLTRRILQVNSLDSDDSDLASNKIVKPDLGRVGQL